jgi:hypothetical protein
MHVTGFDPDTHSSSNGVTQMLLLDEVYTLALPLVLTVPLLFEFISFHRQRKEDGSDGREAGGFPVGSSQNGERNRK